MDDRILFSTLKERRAWYIVDYAPPTRGVPFATLSLTTLQPTDLATVAQAIETELQAWLRRYAVPIVASAFSDTGELLHLDTVRPCSQLIGWLDSADNVPRLEWRVSCPPELPQVDWSTQALRSMYSNVPFRTGADLQVSLKSRIRLVRGAKVVVFIGLVLVPAAWLLIEANASPILSRILAFYGISQIYIQALKLLGRWPKTAFELAKGEEELRMRHHHYHCERNPEGFQRLVAENFDRESREKIRREAASLTITQ